MFPIVRDDSDSLIFGGMHMLGSYKLASIPSGELSISTELQSSAYPS